MAQPQPSHMGGGPMAQPTEERRHGPASWEKGTWPSPNPTLQRKGGLIQPGRWGGEKGDPSGPQPSPMGKWGHGPAPASLGEGHGLTSSRSSSGLRA